MAAPPPSGKSLPASFSAVYVQVMADVLGSHGAEAVLRRAGLDSWIPAPPGEGVVDFAEISALLASLEDTIGERGGRGLARRMGAAAFETILKPTGPVAAMQDPAFQSLPETRKVQAGLHTVARMLSQTGDWSAQTADRSDGASFRSASCPHCWARQSEAPVCAPTLGLVAAALRWISSESEAEFEETACLATGADACQLIVRLAAHD